jgi:REP element-mobilizing transposase RayT
MKTESMGKVNNSKMQLSEIGQIASQMWYEIPIHFPFIDLDVFVVMPNHIHGIIVINRFVGTPIVGALHATPLLHPMEFIPVQIFYSYRNRQINSFKIRPSLTTSKDGLKTLNIH